MPDQKDQREEQLKSRYNVRQVTNIQASWVKIGFGGLRQLLQIFLELALMTFLIFPVVFVGSLLFRIASADAVASALLCDAEG